MNYLKTFFITTILLNINTTFNAQDYQAYTQEQPAVIQGLPQLANADAPIITQEEALIQEEAPVQQEITTQDAPKKEKTALDLWNDHLETIQIESQLWDSSHNVPESNWTTQAITLAKSALDKDHAITESLKSNFFDTINAKIDLEKGKFSEKTFALITEFNEALDAHLKTISDAETARQAAKTIVLEETKPEPTVDVAPAPVETTPTPVTQESTQSENSTSTNGDNSKDLFTKWDDLIRTIATEGKTFDETKKLISSTYEQAKQLLPTISNPEVLPIELKDALEEHNTQAHLSPINVNDALTAFSEITGIPMPTESAYDQYSDAAYQQRLNAEKEMQRKEQQNSAKQMIAQKALDLAREREGEQKQESMIQKLQLQYQQRLAQFEAATRAETDAKLAQLRQELKTANVSKNPATSPGIIGTAIGAVKDAASAASRWWYGTSELQATVISLADDQERLKKLHALLNAMPLTKNEKTTIEQNWTLFISSLRSAPQLADKANETTNKEWINTIGKALDNLVIKYHIISLKDACDIVEYNLEASPNRSRIIKEITKYLEEKKRKIIEAKQKQESAQLKKTQQKEKRANIILLEQQKIKDEEDRKKTEEQNKHLTIDSYNNERKEWNQLLTKLSHNKQATMTDNNAKMRDAVTKSQSLLNLARNIPLSNRSTLSQELKQEFTNALLEQQKLNEQKINIHQTMEQFNTIVNKMVE